MIGQSRMMLSSAIGEEGLRALATLQGAMLLSRVMTDSAAFDRATDTPT